MFLVGAPDPDTGRPERNGGVRPVCSHTRWLPGHEPTGLGVSVIRTCFFRAPLRHCPREMECHLPALRVDFPAELFLVRVLRSLRRFCLNFSPAIYARRCQPAGVRVGQYSCVAAVLRSLRVQSCAYHIISSRGIGL